MPEKEKFKKITRLWSYWSILPISVILGLFTLLKKRYSLPSDCLSSCVPCILSQNHCLRRCRLEFFTFLATHSVDWSHNLRLLCFNSSCINDLGGYSLSCYTHNTSCIVTASNMTVHLTQRQRGLVGGAQALRSGFLGLNLDSTPS